MQFKRNNYFEKNNHFQLITFRRAHKISHFPTKDQTENKIRQATAFHLAKS